MLKKDSAPVCRVRSIKTLVAMLVRKNTSVQGPGLNQTELCTMPTCLTLWASITILIQWSVEEQTIYYI